MSLKTNNIKIKCNKVLEWLIHIISYALILMLMTVVFPKSFYINHEYFGFYALLISIIIYILNKAIKPIIVFLTLPITGLTLGIFYPFINLFILFLVSLILGKNFEMHGFFMSLLVSILISTIHFIIDRLIFKNLLNKIS